MDTQAKQLLQKAVIKAGGETALARAIGVKQQHVWNWLNRDKKIPGEFAIPIERATGGEVTRHDLRPDLYPKEEAAMQSGKQ